MIRVALVVILLLGVAFAYREVSKTSPHDQAVAALKHTFAVSGQGDPASVSCNSKPSPIPAGFAAWGNVTMFDCSFADPGTGTVHGMCMMHGGKLSQVTNGWAQEGEGTCASLSKLYGDLTSGTLPSLPSN
jgi:hypothetical protein